MFWTSVIRLKHFFLPWWVCAEQPLLSFSQSEPSVLWWCILGTPPLKRSTDTERSGRPLDFKSCCERKSNHWRKKWSHLFHSDGFPDLILSYCCCVTPESSGKWEKQQERHWLKTLTVTCAMQQILIFINTLQQFLCHPNLTEKQQLRNSNWLQSVAVFAPHSNQKCWNH